jgi:hypothetical protein
MRNRGFGVELEFDSNGLGIDGVADLLEQNGFSDWVGKSNNNNYYGDGYYEYSGLGEDGSEIELRTPILHGKKGFEDLFKVVKLLNNADCYTTDADGLHVHHDAPEFVGNKELVVKLLKSWKYNEVHIAKFVDEARADLALSHEYDSPCSTFRYESITRYELQRGNHVGYDNGFERNNLNINALNEHGSIEFRFHEGTLDWPEIEAWIRFGQSFLNGVVARKNAIMPTDSPVILLNRLKTNESAKKFLIRKAGVR